MCSRRVRTRIYADDSCVFDMYVCKFGGVRHVKTLGGSKLVGRLLSGGGAMYRYVCNIFYFNKNLRGGHRRRRGGRTVIHVYIFCALLF